MFKLENFNKLLIKLEILVYFYCKQFKFALSLCYVDGFLMFFSILVVVRLDGIAIC